MCRHNLRQLDEMTAGLQRRLLAADSATEDSSETAVPLSTSSAFMPAGTALHSGTWEPQSTLRSGDHVTSDTLASTDATAGDALTELMRRTLESTGSHVQDLSRTRCDVQDHASDGDDVYVGNSPRDGCAGNIFLCDGAPEEQTSETRASTDVDRYSDSLRSAQVLLKRLSAMTTGCSSSPTAVPRVGDSPTAGDSDDDVMHEEDDTLASIWALRQSARRDDSDRDSVDSSVLPDDRESSYVAPQALNDVYQNAADLSASSQTVDDPGGCGDAGDLAGSMSERTEQPALGRSGGTGDTWFIDTQDLRAIDNRTSTEVRQRLQEETDSDPLDADEAAAVAEDGRREVCSPGRPLSQSSPAQFSPAGSMARRSRPLKRTAIQRHEQMRSTADSSDSESDRVDNPTRLRDRHPQNSQHAPRDRPSAGNEAPLDKVSSAAVDGQPEDVVDGIPETFMAANQESEDNIEDEPQSAGSDVVTAAEPASQGSPARNAGRTVLHDQALNGHHSASGEDSYPFY